MGEKRYWKFWENFRKFSKIFFRKLLKCIIFACYSINLANHALIFRGFDEKRKLLGNFENILKFFDENSIEKFNFYFIFIFENLWLKIEPSEITPFLQQFFRFPEGGFPPPLTLASPLPKGEGFLMKKFEKLFHEINRS